MDAARNLASDPAHIQVRVPPGGGVAGLHAGVAHVPASAAIYECDDMCGSFWQSLPVDPTGRDGKSVVADQAVGWCTRCAVL